MLKIISSAEMREIDRLTGERYATPSLLLMEAAANASARRIGERFGHQLSGLNVRVFCGRGNNGGDGAALARALWTAGARVDVVLFGRVEETKGDARTNFEMVRRLSSFAAGSRERPSLLSFVECDTLEGWEESATARRNYDVLVDALFGTGLTRPLEGVFRAVVEHVTLVREAREHAGEEKPLVVSLDIPSGLDADSSEPVGAAVRADMTVTFTAPKPANVLPPAADFNGRLHVADIGSPPALLAAAPSELYLVEADDARGFLRRTRYTPGSYKNTHGHALVVAGSRRLTGAAILCADACARAGAGLVTLAAPASALPAVAARLMPEVMTLALHETEEGAANVEAFEDLLKFAERATVVALGPGLTSDSAETRYFVRTLVERRARPLVIDADGLNSLAPWPAELRGSHEAPIIITPHEGEMRRLLGLSHTDAAPDAQAETAKDDRANASNDARPDAMNGARAGSSDDVLRAGRVRVVREFAARHGLIVVLKGTRTLVAAPDGRVFVNPTGNAGLGTAGSGDTLTGIITAFNAQAFATLKDRADALAATVAAVYVGGLAGDFAARARGMRAMVASDIREHFGEAVRALDEEGERP